MSTMRAAYITARVEADRIIVGELPIPEPSGDEVRVRVLASAVNMVDTFVRSGAYSTDLTFPFVIGRDLVGIVDALGPDVVGTRVGDVVWCNSLGHAGRQGAAAEYALVEQNRLYPLPERLTASDAAITVALCHPGATAYLALFVHGRAQADETVVIQGGAGNVGRLLIQLAQEADLRVVTTCSASDRTLCQRLGANVVLDYRSPTLTDELRQAADHLNHLLATQRIEPLPVETLPLTDAASAHRRLENGQVRGGRLVLVPDES